MKKATDNNKFDDFKKEILKRAKESNACKSQYRRAYQSKNFAELAQVLKDNFNYACNNKIIDIELIETAKPELAENDIYCNVSVTKGFLLVGNATVEAWDNATVKAWDNATVKAWDNATVEAVGTATVKAWDNATVEAWGNATVEAWGNATVEAWGNATVKAWGNATVEAVGNATVKAVGTATVKAWDNATVEAWDNATVEAWDNATVKAWDNATVKAWDNSFISSYYTIECKISDKAIYRCISTNEIRIVNNSYTIKTI